MDAVSEFDAEFSSDLSHNCLAQGKFKANCPCGRSPQI